MRRRAAALAVTVIFQFLLEVTAGKVFVAPSLVPFMLVYMSENFEGYWAVEGAFWSGLCLDLLLHQPPGSSSLAYLAGMYAAGMFGRVSSGEGSGFLISMTAIAVAVSDSVFILVAARPIGSGFGPLLLKVPLRTALTVAVASVVLLGASWLTGLRSRNVSG
ncbi:MAG: hypothetical protein AVO35_05290 [Candidatus Aegiribacteria sp. MLS_C]|nr:MAG: hypothetical protein AVO35_05290 [Candidatus Aegiribacteria sp. MLS_C]